MDYNVTNSLYLFSYFIAADLSKQDYIDHKLFLIHNQYVCVCVWFMFTMSWSVT